MVSAWLLMMQAVEELSLGAWLIWSAGMILFAGSLIAACIMDLKEQMVYRFLWLIGGLGASALMVLKMYGEGMSVGVLVNLVVYMGLQQVWFVRFYGRADCHAFCVCAAVMAAIGLSLRDYVMHMLLTFVGLTVVQLIRRNVACNGKLKKPVPLVPYITAAFWLWVDFAVGKWYI